MHQSTFAFVIAAVLLAPVVAHAENPHNGTWSLTFQGQKAADLEGKVTVKEDGGSWDIVALSRKNPCVGRQFPITVQKADADELVLTVNREKTLVGCKDSTYTFKKADGKTLKADFGEGRTALLSRN